jgi:hypothetical protein
MWENLKYSTMKQASIYVFLIQPSLNWVSTKILPRLLGGNRIQTNLTGYAVY